MPVIIPMTLYIQLSWAQTTAQLSVVNTAHKQSPRNCPAGP